MGTRKRKTKRKATFPNNLKSDSTKQLLLCCVYVYAIHIEFMSPECYSVVISNIANVLWFTSADEEISEKPTHKCSGRREKIEKNIIHSFPYNLAIFLQRIKHKSTPSKLETLP